MVSIDLVAVLSVGVALALSRVDRRLRIAGQEGGPRAGGARPVGGGLRPGLALLLVSVALAVNQVLVPVYIDRVHDGDVTFVSRWLPDGWFELPHSGVLDGIAAVWPAPEFLAPSLLRVAALLELPFVVLAYVTMAGFLSPALAQRLARGAMLWAASLSFTAVFCIVEWHFSNPWTAGDLVLRVATAAATPLVVARFVRADEAADTSVRDADPAGLAIFVVSAAALAHLVLVLYDTVLLYNLGRVDRHLVPAGVSAAVLLSARVAASRRSAVDAGPTTNGGRRIEPGRSASGLIARLLTCGFALFFVPSLAVRYEVTFGSRAVALTAVGVLALATVLRARPSLAATLRLVAAASLGAAVAAAVRFGSGLTGSDGPGIGWLPGTYESRVLVTGTLGALLVIGLGALVDRVLGGSEGRGWEKRAPAALHAGASDGG